LTDETRQEKIARIKEITRSPEFLEKRRAHFESGEHARHALERSDGLGPEIEWMGVDGDAWMFWSPVSAESLMVGDYTIDCIVDHRLRPIEAFEGGTPTEEARPVVRRITRIERSDGEPLGAEEIRLDLNMVAIEAVVRNSHHVYFRVPADGRSVYIASNTEPWRAAAQAVRLAAYWYGPRMKWSSAITEEMVRHWCHIVDHGCGTAADLADALGTTARRVQTRLSELRKQGRDIPKGKSGRRRRKDDD
jgi:hypothetical protein